MAETIIQGQKIFYQEKISDKISDKNSDTIAVFLHGWGGSGSAFSSLFSPFLHVVTFDFPGSGNSSPLQKPFTLEDYTRITEEFFQKKIFQKFPQKKIILIGHSFGGRVMLKLLDMFPEIFTPEKISHMAFIAVPFYRENTMQTRFTGKIVSFMNTFLPHAFKPMIKKIIFSVIGENDYFELGENPILKKTFQNIVSEDISVYFPHLQKFPEISVWWGEKDRVIPISFAYDAQKEVSQMVVFPFPEGTHFPWIDVGTHLPSSIFLDQWSNFFLKNKNI